MTTELTLPQRAAVALNSAQHEQDLIELASKSKDIVEVLNNDGRTQAHRAAMTLRETRTTITSTAKTAREDATAFSKAIIEEERRLISIISPEETRLLALRDIWDKKIEDEKQAKIAAERARIKRIQDDIQRIKDTPSNSIGKSIEELNAIHSSLEELNCTEERFEEFVSEAASAVSTSLYGIVQLVFKKQEEIKLQEERAAEAARLKAEREENERIRLELAAKQAILDAEADKQRQEREAEQAHAMAAQKKLDDERSAFEAEKRAQLAAIAKEQAEKVRSEQIATALIAETAKQIESEKTVNKVKISKQGIVYAVAHHFSVSEVDAEHAINHYFKTESVSA